MMQVERNWLNPDGIPGRPWFKHILYGARFTYAHLELPGLTEAVEKGDWTTARQQGEILQSTRGQYKATRANQPRDQSVAIWTLVWAEDRRDVHIPGGCGPDAPDGRLRPLPLRPRLLPKPGRSQPVPPRFLPMRLRYQKDAAHHRIDRHYRSQPALDHFPVRQAALHYHLSAVLTIFIS